ncbi:MAG: dodecin family protein [Pseudomonadota bacterium]|jgi:flavin-binding protein dodecin
MSSEVAPQKRDQSKPQLVATSCISKIIELQAESSKSWEDAVQLCLAEAVRTVRNISSISVSEFSATVREDAVQRFHVRCKVAFAIDDSMRAH